MRFRLVTSLVGFAAWTCSTAGSGNIGATNAARVLGRPLGIIVFLLDFMKGVAPVVIAVPLARSLNAEVTPDLLRVGAAALTFLGHLFPVYLGFRGGKGVATGAGTVFVLSPVAAILAILMWVVVLFASRHGIARVARCGHGHRRGTHYFHPAPFSRAAIPISLYLVVGTAFVFVKHRAMLNVCSQAPKVRFPIFRPGNQSCEACIFLLLVSGSAEPRFLTSAPRRQYSLRSKMW